MKITVVNRSEERELFLKYIVDVYFKNSNLSISHDIIYNELSRFSTYGGEHYIIDGDSLIGVQVNLNNKYRTDGRVNTLSNGYFWAIENRCGKKDKDFFDNMYNAIKIYVSVDTDNIYKVSESLFNFMISEDIVMQCKISKGMRNDALVCRIFGKENATKVIDYINGLVYEAKFRPNPFLLDSGKVSVAVDGHLSYNNILSKLMMEYFKIRKKENSLDKVNCTDFNDFVKKQIELLSSGKKSSLMNLYQISNEERCRDFIVICNLISKNLDGTLDLDGVIKYDRVYEIKVNSNLFVSSNIENKLLYVINFMDNKYGKAETHERIRKFLETCDYNLFTRDGNKDKSGKIVSVRNVVKENFTPEIMRKVMFDIGWKSLLDVSKATYDKYGEDQLLAAFDNLFNDSGLVNFTNDDGNRSRLGLVILPEFLKILIVNKLEENNMEISNISLMQLVLDEISNKSKKKKVGRN